MSFQTTVIRYGWVYLTALGVITGTTIYVVDNQRKQVKPEDIIEIALGVTERCLATQYATNPLYYVSPPSFTRTWTDTNGASVVVTNTIGWHTDRAMMVSLDSTIKALVTRFVDTNTVYDGTTNIAMMTVTGLWASLQIGDKTNKFTRRPEIGTNAATYGDYPWQIYVEDLQERYKVLNALKMTRVAYGESSMLSGGGAYGARSSQGDSREDSIEQWNETSYGDEIWGQDQMFLSLLSSPYWVCRKGYGRSRVDVTTNISCSAKIWIVPSQGLFARAFGDIEGFGFENLKLVYFHSISESSVSPKVSDFFYDHFDDAMANACPWVWQTNAYGYGEGEVTSCSARWVLEWHFNYCTNRFWE